VTARPPVAVAKAGPAVVPAADPDRRAAEYVLSVGGKVRVNGSDTRLAELPPGPFRLTGISLQSNRQVTDAGLAVLAGCRHLEVAWLNGSAVGDAGLAHLNTTSLRELHVDTRPVTDAGLARFAAAKDLTQLNVGYTRVTGPGLAALANCPNLTKLWAYGLAIGDADLEVVRRWKNLEHLSLSRTKVTDAGLPRLAGLTALRDLRLLETKVTADGVNKLAAALPGCKIEWDGGVVGPTDPDRAALDWLVARGTEFGFTDAAGYHKVEAGQKPAPAGKIELNSFRLNAATFTADADLARFAGLKAVTTIVLNEAPVSDAGLAHLEALTRMTHLYLTGSKVTDAGLARLRGFKALRVLHASRTTVTDAGLDHLAGLTALTDLNIQQTRVTAAGVKRLAATLPACKITWDGGVVEPKAADKK
jgi:hypothetical protein